MNERGDPINHIPHKPVSLRISISFSLFTNLIYSLTELLNISVFLPKTQLSTSTR